MRGRWKALFSDSFLQIAVVLSLLRIDLRVYLRQYTAYPELQQALLGQSVGLHLVDNYHNNDLLPLPSSKYIEDSDNIFNEINRLIQSPRPLRHHHTETRIISAWLVTNNTAHSSTSTDPSSVASAISHTELSSQDVALIERLWKQDLDLGVCHGFVYPKEQSGVPGDESFNDEDTGINIPIPGPFSLDSVSNGSPLWTEEQPRTAYSTQTSLEQALLELPPYGEDALEQSQDGTITNSSMLYPEESSIVHEDPWDRTAETNNSGVLWGSAQTLSHMSRQDSTVNLAADGDLAAILADPSLLNINVDMDMDLDFDLDSSEMLSTLYDMRDSVSEDSAVSLGENSPHHSWSDRTSTNEGERHSLSSEDLFDFEDGAVGYSECKTEPYDNGFFEDERTLQKRQRPKHVVLHDHTYGAPHGGVPHVRKMDIKTVKVPSRGLAHDEAMCRKFKIPFSVETIIDIPMDEFNTLLEEHKLNSKQTKLVRDIRRRGKNKVAAQNCRVKKNDELYGLDGEVAGLRTQRDTLNHKKTVLLNKTAQVQKHIDIMSAEIFSTLRDENGMPYDTSRFSLEVGRNGEIQVTSTEQTTRRSRSSRKKGSSKKRRR